MSYIHINSQLNTNNLHTFNLTRKDAKPHQHASALTTLKNIETILSDYKNYTNNHDPKERSLLLSYATLIKDRYLEKTKKISWIIRWLFNVKQKETDIKKTYDIVMQYYRTITNNLDNLPTALTRVVCSFLDPTEVACFATTSKKIKLKAQKAQVQWARTYGYNAIDFHGANAHLEMLYLHVTKIFGGSTLFSTVPPPGSPEEYHTERMHEGKRVIWYCPVVLGHRGGVDRLIYKRFMHVSLCNLKLLIEDQFLINTSSKPYIHFDTPRYLQSPECKKAAKTILSLPSRVNRQKIIEVE